jgi:peptidoglycan/xylan/chitin deacetylase (PgdA/CDA1 family)
MKLATAAAGTALLHAAPAAAFIPGLRRRFLPRLAGIGDAGHVALTFDDGPDPRSTPLFLDLLARHGVRATFFLLADQVTRSPDTARLIVGAGHEIALHGWDHRCLLRRGPRSTYTGLARACDLIDRTTGVRPQWFRAPYGVFSTASLVAARRLDLTPVLWTCWGFDWTSGATGDSVYSRVTRDLRGGGTILLHDSDVTSSRGAWRSTLAALPRVLAHCERNNLKVGPLRDHGTELW